MGNKRKADGSMAAAGLQHMLPPLQLQRPPHATFAAGAAHTGRLHPQQQPDHPGLQHMQHPGALGGPMFPQAMPGMAALGAALPGAAPYMPQAYLQPVQQHKPVPIKLQPAMGPPQQADLQSQQQMHMQMQQHEQQQQQQHEQQGAYTSQQGLQLTAALLQQHQEQQQQQQQQQEQQQSAAPLAPPKPAGDELSGSSSQAEQESVRPAKKRKVHWTGDLQVRPGQAGRAAACVLHYCRTQTCTVCLHT
jgi:hypothetical protein